MIGFFLDGNLLISAFILTHVQVMMSYLTETPLVFVID